MKVLKTIAEQNGMSYHAKELTITGNVQGVPINIMKVGDAKRAIISTHARFSDSPEMLEGVAQRVAEYAKLHKSVVAEYRVAGNTVRAVIKLKSGEAFLSEVRELLVHMSALVTANRLTPCCAACGNETQVSPYMIKEIAVNVCSTCAAEAHEKNVQTEVSNAKAQSSVLMGAVGALLGSLVGAVVWVILYQLGYIAAISGLIAVVCAYKGYTMFSKRKNLTAAIISTIIAFFVIFAAHYVAWGLEIYSAFSADYAITVWDGIKAVPDFVFDPETELMGTFFLDLMYGYIFMAVGSFSFIKSVIKNPAGIDEVKPLRDEATV